MDDSERLRRIEELKKQRDELDRLIDELMKPLSFNTNIPYLNRFIQEYFKPNVKLDLTKFSSEELLEMKIIVNKKCNQISADFTHTANIAKDMFQYKNNVLFCQIFAHKLIDQGRVQVSSHLESYKPLSFILFMLQSKDIVETYVNLMITREGNEMELRGIYAIYFGYLNLKEDVEACWKWMAAIMNVSPNIKTGYIFEVFLIIVGDMLNEKISFKFQKIIRYTRTYFLKDIANPAVEARIEIILQKYLK